MKIAVLVSGGVDSSVALRLLKEQGHELTAFYLKIWLEDELSFLGECPWEQDLAYVRNVCEQQGVPLEIISLQEEYRDRVVSYTVAEVKAGRTPSPDLLCNKLIKFGAFFDHIRDEFEKVATGHYASIEEKDGMFYLKKAKDPIKDQTYFLSRLTQEQLSKLLFPLGVFEKSEVRELAHKFELPTAERKDSQGICFLGKINFSDFIKHHVGTKTGNLVDIDTQEIVGNHEGFWFHTIGQRKGLGLSGGPWYVVKKDIENNIVYISRNYFTEDKTRNSFSVHEFNWLVEKTDATMVENLRVKIRHGEHSYSCSVKFNENRLSADVQLEERDQGIAAGQFAVFYDGDVCIGSAIIK